MNLINNLDSLSCPNSGLPSQALIHPKSEPQLLLTLEFLVKYQKAIWSRESCRASGFMLCKGLLNTQSSAGLHGA